MRSCAPACPRASESPAGHPSARCGHHSVLIRFFSWIRGYQSAARAANYRIQVWSLKRTENYGSKHLDPRRLEVTRAVASSDGRVVELEIPELRPTWCMEIVCDVKAADGIPVHAVIHNTVHRMGQ